MLNYIFDYYSNPYRMYLKYEFDIVKTQNLQTVLLIGTVRLIEMEPKLQKRTEPTLSLLQNSNNKLSFLFRYLFRD